MKDTQHKGLSRLILGLLALTFASAKPYKGHAEPPLQATGPITCEVLWQDVKKNSDLKSYEAYISKCPEGSSIDEAKKEHERLKYLDTVRTNFHWEYEEFVKQYPNSDYLKDVKARLNQFETFRTPRDTFISNSDLTKKYHWNKVSEGFIWGEATEWCI